MNIEAIDRLIEQDPALETSRDSLTAMQPGTYCIHRSWGFGKITGYDDERNMILINFEVTWLKIKCIIYPLYYA